MKLNRRRIDARIPRWVMEALTMLRLKYDWTFTEALIRTAEKGIAYYKKQWDKMHPKKNGPKNETDDQRCPNLEQEKNTPENITDEQVDAAFASLDKPEESLDDMMKQIFGDKK